MTIKGAVYYREKYKIESRFCLGEAARKTQRDFVFSFRGLTLDGEISEQILYLVLYLIK